RNGLSAAVSIQAGQSHRRPYLLYHRLIEDSRALSLVASGIHDPAVVRRNHRAPRGNGNGGCRPIAAPDSSKATPLLAAAFHHSARCSYGLAEDLVTGSNSGGSYDPTQISRRRTLLVPFAAKAQPKGIARVMVLAGRLRLQPNILYRLSGLSSFGQTAS